MIDKFSAVTADLIRQDNIAAGKHAGLALDFGGALYCPQQHEGARDVVLAYRDAVIAEHQDVSGPKATELLRRSERR